MVRVTFSKRRVLIPGSKYSKTSPFQGLLGTPDLPLSPHASSPCWAWQSGTGVARATQLPGYFIHTTNKTLSLFGQTALRRRNHNPAWACWCARRTLASQPAGGLWHPSTQDSGIPATQGSGISTQRTLAPRRPRGHPTHGHGVLTS